MISSALRACIECRKFFLIKPGRFSRAMDRAPVPVHQDFALRFKIVHTGRLRSMCERKVNFGMNYFETANSQAFQPATDQGPLKILSLGRGNTWKLTVTQRMANHYSEELQRTTAGRMSKQWSAPTGHCHTNWSTDDTGILFHGGNTRTLAVLFQWVQHAYYVHL